MRIQLFLNNEEEYHITTFYDMNSNPFKLNDIINLKIEDIYPVEYEKFNKEFKEKILNNNKELFKKFNLKKIKLVKEEKYLEFKDIGENNLIIEYHCEIID
jgi:hypothetical protein